jgi:hypothetical protein
MSTQSPTWRTPLARWRDNPERTAWTLLLGAFAIFVVLAVAMPVGIVWMMRYATLPQTGALQPTIGTILLYSGGTGEPIAITELRENISEGDRLVALDDSTQATLSLNSDPDTEDVLGSVQIYSGTDLTLNRLRQPMFDSSREPFQSVLTLDAGQARIFTSGNENRTVDVELRTPHGVAMLAPGSYQVSVDPIATEITVRSGTADLRHDDGTGLVVQVGERAKITGEGVSAEVTSPEQNLVTNGNFTPPVLDTWTSYQVAEADTTPGKVQFIEGEDGRQVSQFIRMGEERLHTEVGISQVLNRPVNVYDELRIQADVKILFQSLPGGGTLNSEFPIRIEVGYTDVYGKDLTWGHGFYYREAEPGEEYPRVVDGTRVSQGQWYTYLSPNLIDLLSELGTRPAQINSMRIYASGHNYQSVVSEVYLLAE